MRQWTLIGQNRRQPYLQYVALYYIHAVQSLRGY